MDPPNQNNDEEMSDNNIVGGASSTQTSGGGTDNGSLSTSPDSSKVGNKTKNEDEVSTLAKREGRNVRIWRRNVFLMLLVTAALLTSLTYIFLKDEDKEDFDTSFFQFASTIRDSLKFNLLGVIEATSGLGEYLTAEAIKTNSEWPFMTLSSFEVYVSHTRAQASSELIVVAPIVTASNLEDWSHYSQANQGWIDESFAAQGGREDYNQIPSNVYRFGQHKGRKVLKPEDGTGKYPTAPFWQMSRPPFDTSIINFNSLSTEEYQKSYDDMMASRQWVFGVAGPNNLIDYTISEEGHDALHSSTSQLIQEANAGGAGFANHHPHTNLIYPVFQELNQEGSDIVAMVVNILPWDNYLKNALPAGVDGIYCILHNTDGQVFSYVVNGQDASYLGGGDFHDTTYDDMGFIIDFDDFLDNENHEHESDDGTDEYGIHYWFAVYPSAELEDEYKSGAPIIFACVAAAAFAFMTATFMLYDWYVIRKNNKILKAATRSNAILSSLFPQEVKQKLLQEEEAKNKRGTNWRTRDGMSKYISNDGMGNNKFYDNDDEIDSSKPIADLFPDATVLFADLVGFTAWSSTREPTAVFTLLETLFNAFDKIAARKRVYKVETIGDCYVAVTGLPDPNPKHAEDMCKFAKEIFHKMQQLTNKLEELLGPDTSSLSMRFGIHSGPVTAGVLRGERSRFQLFGDTMNTASRMESLGRPGKIHLSQETADLLVAAGKGNLIEKRKDKVLAKGKGELQTFWLVQSESRTGSITTGSEDEPSSAPTSEIAFRDASDENDVKTQRAIQWTVSCFSSLLKSIIASRGPKPKEVDGVAAADERSCRTESTDPTSKIPLDEVLEVIDLSRRECSLSPSLDPGSVELPPEVYAQLAEYITTIAGMYNKHPFHCFEHASHVVMSVLKLLSRFQSGDNEIDGNDGRTATSEDHAEIVERQNFGYLTQDPLIKFSLAFSALIHDIIHPGVSNDVLIKEEPDLAEHYKMRSVAEQRSLDEAWELLMEEKFRSLRDAIYQTREEEDRFRQLVINSLLATDIMDPDLKKLRTDRWNRAFHEDELQNGFSQTSMDRKATIVIEHLIQTSDVSHTMQHWNVFRKWNERLFQEMYKAYMDGRSEKDPSEFWYRGEIGFFDFYVIPLAERLKQCGDELGLTTGSDEYLVYAKMNRDEWESKGVEIVAQMKAQFLANHNGGSVAESLGSPCDSAI